MNRIDLQLDKIQNEKRLGLMTHVVIGYPTLQQTIPLVIAMEKAGADFIELQIPFSDPLADGPTIMKACEEALKKGTKVKDAFHVAENLSESVHVPLLFMAYYNTLFSYGVEKFCRDAHKAGISGVIVPDMPIDEEASDHFLKSCQKNHLYAIRVISPASTNERMKKNARVAKGFVYCTARQGITDAQKAIAPEITQYLKEAKRVFKKPLAVGFGISTRERVELIRPYANIAIVGSGVVEIIHKSNEKNMLANVSAFIKELGV